jgi:hypothetical protein
MTYRVGTAICCGLVLALALPRKVRAQFSGAVDVRSGPVAWDQSDAGDPRDPLLNGELNASYLLPRLLGLRPDLLGQFGASTEPTGQAALGWDLGVRLNTAGTTAGAWLSAAVGAAGTRRPRNRLTKLEGGFRRAIGPARINLWLARTGFGAGVAPEGGLGQDSSLPDTLVRKSVVGYTDVGSRVSFGLNRYELGAALTRRIGSISNRHTAWELNATWWMAPGLGLIGAAGHSLPQLGYTIPGGRYTTLGLRLTFGTRSPAKSAREPTAAAPSAAPASLIVADRRLRIQGPLARSAEVMGDFTNWEPRPMAQLSAGSWTLPGELSPGVHHLNVRFDGGPWLVPEGAIAVDDGFGGRAGMVVVR